MKLKRIELLGFKSFVDRTVLEFGAGITAILGPNGCGKSNIVDAVRWVLGEQSAKTLRGDKMDDVIFKGTTKRRPVGLAEVTLTFINDDGRLPVDYEEVAIKRRVTRDGTSDYFLNGTLCRLKDLRDLLWDSGVNNTSYSIIEESMIKQILNDNNQELRRLLDEGSGITKYKARRKETERKLERTRQDLLRLDDIIEEIGREVRSLQRQVGKARRHQRLFGEIRALDVGLAALRHRQLDQREVELKDRVQDLRTLAEADSGELNELRGKIAAQRPLEDEREAERRQLEEALQAFEEELQECERQVVVLEQRIDEFTRRCQEAQAQAAEAAERRVEVEGRIDGLQHRLESLRTAVTEASRQLAELAEELRVVDAQLAAERQALEQAVQLNLQFIENDAAGKSEMRELLVRRENRQERFALLEDEAAALAAEAAQAAGQEAEQTARREELIARRRALLEHRAAAERQATDLEAQAQEIQQEVSIATGRREAAAGRLELLQRLQAEHAGYGQGARHVLTAQAANPEVLGSLADRLQVEEAWIGPFETLLGEILDAVVVGGAGAAAALVQDLRAGEHGLASFLCRCDVAGGAAAPAPAGGRPAGEVVQGATDDLPHLRRLLQRTFLFERDDQATAAALAAAAEPPVLCLSRQGLLVGSDGLVRGGGGERGEISLLGRLGKLDKLQEDLTALEHKVTAAETKLAANRQEREARQALLRTGREDLAALAGELQTAQVALAQLGDRTAARQTRRQEIAGVLERLQQEIAELARAEEVLQASLHESGRLRQDSTLQREELRRRVLAGEQRRDEMRAAHEEARLRLQRLQGEQREADTGIAHLRANLGELQARRDRLLAEADHGRQENERLGEELAAARDRLLHGFQERERRRQIVRHAAQAIQELRRQTEQWHDRIKAIEDQRHGCRDQIHQLETELATIDLRRNNLEERVEQQYGASFAQLVAALADDQLPRELEREDGVFQAEQAEALLEARRKSLAELGPINHLALEEYETKKQRLDFLEGQRADVVKARDDLERAIAEINRTARRLFSSTFDAVRRNYIDVFQTLFEGGSADLQLVRTDDPLESEIRISARPTGKVIDNVSLLSGGERCLTALSILFAVYLVKPSPFCLLDEADAPLDDMNIARFVRMLRQFSQNTQFLVVTHNKLTMETANHLYGVTMMEKGCSSIVSVSFRDVADARSDSELAGAIDKRRRPAGAGEGQPQDSLVGPSPEDEAEAAAEAEPDGSTVAEPLDPDEPDPDGREAEA